MARTAMNGKGFLDEAISDYYRNIAQPTTAEERLGTLTAGLLIACDPATEDEYLQTLPTPLQATWQTSHREQLIRPSVCDTASTALASRLPHVFTSKSLATLQAQQAVRTVLRAGVDDTVRWIAASTQTSEPIAHENIDGHPTIRAGTTLSEEAQEAAFLTLRLEPPNQLPVDHEGMVALARRGMELAAARSIELDVPEDPRALDVIGNCPATNAPNWLNALARPVLYAYTGIYPAA